MDEKRWEGAHELNQKPPDGRAPARFRCNPREPLCKITYQVAAGPPRRDGNKHPESPLRKTMIHGVRTMLILPSMCSGKPVHIDS